MRWLVGWLVDWLVGCLVGRASWLVGWLVCLLVVLVAWLVGWLPGWLAVGGVGCLDGSLLVLLVCLERASSGRRRLLVGKCAGSLLVGCWLVGWLVGSEVGHWPAR